MEGPYFLNKSSLRLLQSLKKCKISIFRMNEWISKTNNFEIIFYWTTFYLIFFCLLKYIGTNFVSLAVIRGNDFGKKQGPVFNKHKNLNLTQLVPFTPQIFIKYYYCNKIPELQFEGNFSNSKKWIRPSAKQCNIPKLKI